MKRIFLVGLIGLFLTGCGENSVSDEMFVGDWKCKNVNYISNWDGKGFGEFKIDGESKEVLLSIKYENNILYAKDSKTGEWGNGGSLIETYNNQTLKEESDISFIETTQSLRRENNDKFMLIYENKMTAKDNKYSSFNRIIKDETTCTRIK